MYEASQPNAFQYPRLEGQLSLDGPLGQITRVIYVCPSSFGQPVENVEIMPPEGATQRLAYGDLTFNSLVTLCSELSPATTHSLAEAQPTLRKSFGQYPIRLLEKIPPGVLKQDGRSIIIGNVALASRLATKEDVAADLARRKQYARAEVDKNKTSILQQDHARIEVDSQLTGQGSYYMPLDRGNALLAVRVLSALESYEGEPFVDGDSIANAVWGAMPTTERGLFLPEKFITRKRPEAIKPFVLDVMRKLTSRLGITHETTGEHFVLEGKVNITLHDEPPEDPSDLQGFNPIFPPGTSSELIKQASAGAVPPADLNTAQVLIQQLDRPQALSQNQALTILDLITEPSIKRAIRSLVKQAGGERTSASVLEALRSQVEEALGEGFQNAWTNRVVAGNRITKGRSRVRLVGGELPITTNLARVTKKWHVG